VLGPVVAGELSVEGVGDDACVPDTPEARTPVVWLLARLDAATSSCWVAAYRPEVAVVMALMARSDML
jgi:hypothetical protein